MKKIIFKMCVEMKLSQWHYAAALILLKENGFENAKEFLLKCKP